MPGYFIYNNLMIAERISAALEDVKDEMTAFIQTLVRTPSLTSQEGAVQALVAEKLKSLGLQVEHVPLVPGKLEGHPAFSPDGFPLEGRLNLVGTWQGSGEKNHRTLILSGHVDVVAPGPLENWQDSPWSGKLSEGRIFGRGSADMKAGLSAAIFAVQALGNLGFRPAGDMQVQSVVGEETGGCGTLANIIEGYRADAAVIMEPTGLKIYPLHAGALSFRITVTGQAAHACMKNRGVSAIEKFYPIFTALEDLDRERHRGYSNPLFPDPENVAPLSVGTLVSGDWPSSVPGKLTAEGRFGIFPGESMSEARALFENKVRETAQKDDWLRKNPPRVEWVEGQFEPAETALDEPVVRVLAACHRAVTGLEVGFEAATFGSDVRLFTNHAGIPAVLYGPGDVSRAHAANESIALEEVLQAAKVLALTIVDWCGGEIQEVI